MLFAKTIFEMVGGEAKIDAFIDDFAQRIKANPELGPLYPDDMERLKASYKDYAMELFDGPKAFSGKHEFHSIEQAHKDIPITKQRADEMVRCAVETMQHFHLPKAVQEAALHRVEDKVYDMVNA